MILSKIKYQSTSSQIKKDSFSNIIELVEAQMLSLVTIGHGNISPAMNAARYHLDTGGQRIRARLGAHSGLALNLEIDDIVAISTSVELLHNASLVHDDLQDKSESRRNKPAIWKKYGNHIAVCTGDLLIASAYAALATLSTKDQLPKLLNLFHKKIASSIKGQISDLNLTYNNISDLSIYERIAAAKSAPLFSLPTEMALIISGQDTYIEAALNCHTQFAIAYQIFDDIQDITEDRARLHEEPSLNALIILENTNTSDTAKKIAIGRAKDLLLDTIKGLEGLPNNCSGLLSIYCQTLLTQLSVQ
tara:strand:+ start:1046 stop:1960 length:915 start_codon:yes stop_codon:yes gene_type:complete